jgi:hypothetical protein
LGRRNSSAVNHRAWVAFTRANLARRPPRPYPYPLVLRASGAMRWTHRVRDCGLHLALYTSSQWSCGGAGRWRSGHSAFPGRLVGRPLFFFRGELRCLAYKVAAQKKPYIFERIASPYRPHRRPDWPAVARLHQGLPYLNDWSQQPEWINDPANWVESGT